MSPESVFFAEEEYIKKIKPEVIIRLNAFKDALLVKIKFRSKAKKIIEKINTVTYSRNDKAYFLPVWEIKNYLQELKTEGLSFAVEKSAGVYLRDSAVVREKIIAGNYQPTEKDLRKSLLFPLITQADDRGTRFSFQGWRTEQLRELLPEYTDFSSRKFAAGNLNRSDLFKLIYRSRLKKIKIWLEQDTLNLLEEQKKNLIFEPVFKSELLALSSPEIFWFLNEKSQPALAARDGNVLKQRLRSFDNRERQKYFLNKAEDYDAFKTLNCYVSAFPEFYEKMADSEMLPRTQEFAEFLSRLKQKQYLQSNAERFAQMSDVDIDLSDLPLKANLYPHQRVAIKWLAENPRGFLGDDMGLGKTLSVLAAFAKLKAEGVADFLLIICPNSLVTNWRIESRRWLDKIDIIFLPDSKKEREATLRKISHGIISPQGLIINYEELRLGYVLAELQKVLSGRQVLLCVDESQRVKNPRSQTFKALRTIKDLCRRRVLLSGTPAPKDIGDLWAQMYLLDDGERFGDNYYKWLSEIAEIGDRYSKFSVVKFRERDCQEYLLKFKELLLRRKKENVLNLPEKIFLRRDLKMKGEQLERYRQIREELLIYISKLNGEAFIKQIDNVMEQFLRAVQAASNPRLIDPLWKGEPVKFTELDEIVQEVVAERGEKLVIWTNYRLNVQELILRYSKYQARPLYGEVKAEERSKYLAEFQSEESKSPKIIVAIPAAAGVGLTLTAARTAVYLDKTWNAEHWLQSVDRLHRIGQNNTVNIISLNACQIDYLINKNLAKKDKFLAKLLDEPVDLNADYAPDRQQLMDALKMDSWESGS